MASPKKPLALSTYRDQQFQGTRQEQEEKLKTSSTLYVGNLSFFTSEDQIYHLFSKCGDVKRVVMGLDRNQKTPCGFCFVEYYSRVDAEDALRYVSQTRLDERIIRCDWDAGFVEGRQYGRGRSGGQVRDEFRTDYDGDRGGFGRMVQQRLERGPDVHGPPGRRGAAKRKLIERDEDDVLDVTDLRQKLKRPNDIRRQFGLDEPEDNEPILPPDFFKEPNEQESAEPDAKDPEDSSQNDDAAMVEKDAEKVDESNQEPTMEFD